MHRRILLFVFIIILGLILRLHQYDSIPPFGETKDEFLYPWLGTSLIQTGVPVGWSLLPSYKNVQDVVYWGEQFRLTSPWLEKPPLYSLLVGTFSMLNGEAKFDQIKLSTVRVVPIMLSLVSLLFVGLVGIKAFHPTVGILAMIIYATTPIIVMSNRMSVTESLIAPTFLVGLWLIIQNSKSAIYKYRPLLFALLTIVVLLTKQTGIALPIVFFITSMRNKEWKSVIGVVIGTVIAMSVMPILGFVYGWDLYQQMQKDLFFAVNLGVPETYTNFFRFLGVGHKESLFLDGTLLAGFILLFAMPFVSKLKKEFSPIFSVGYFYILVLILLLSGTTWYGWYVFPLYPFIALAVALAFFDLWQDLDYFKLSFFFIFLGSSSLRFVLLISQTTLSWQPLLFSAFTIMTILWWLSKDRFKRILLCSTCFIYIFINIYTVINLQKIYPSQLQPQNQNEQTP